MVMLNPQLLPLNADAEGVIRVGGTRVTLESVLWEFKNGASAEDIAYAYDSLRLADIYLVISFYLRNSEEVDRYLASREKQGDAMEAEAAKRGDTAFIRQRLMERRAK